MKRINRFIKRTEEIQEIIDYLVEEELQLLNLNYCSEDPLAKNVRYLHLEKLLDLENILSYLNGVKNLINDIESLKD